jgi:3-hydroxyacyl-CoA dehydrogenase
VRNNLKSGADVTKLFTGSWIARGHVLPMPLNIASAAVQTTHLNGKIVFAHPSNLAGTRIAIESGVDVLAHAPDETTGIGKDLFAEMVQKNMAMTPTLKMFATTVTPDPAYLDPIYAEVRQFHSLGGTLIFGTDVGYSAAPPCWAPPTWPTMGSRIAAHLANAGIPASARHGSEAGEGAQPLALSALDALAKAKPAAFYEPSLAALITPGNFDDDLPKLAQCDWVIEAVAENLAIKTALLARVLPHLAPMPCSPPTPPACPSRRSPPAFPHPRPLLRHALLQSAALHAPARVIPTAETDPAVVAAFAAFADRILGKQVVFAQRHAQLHRQPHRHRRHVQRGQPDARAGTDHRRGGRADRPGLGWPRTGTFRLADMVGIDILAHVAANFPAGRDAGGFLRSRRDAEARLAGRQIRAGLLQEKRGADGKDERLVLDLATFEYRPAAKPALPALEMAKNAATLPERCAAARQRSGQRQGRGLSVAVSGFALELRRRPHRRSRRRRALHRRAMRAGFNWELGPFEMWDAAGVAETVARMKALGFP